MPEYRAYLLDQSGHTSKAAIIIHEDTDDAAITAAKGLLDIHDLDLWQEARHVVTLRRVASSIC